MNNLVSRSVLNLAFVCICLIILSSICFAEAEYLSPTALAVAKNGKSLYIAEYTAKQIAVYDIVKSKVVKVIRVSGNPSGIALDSDGKILYVTIDSPSGIVQLVDLSKSKPTDTIAVGHSPLSPVLSPDNKTLYVCNRFDNSVSVIDTTARKTIAKVQVSREPVSADITPDGKSLYVANFLPGVPANGDYVSSEVSVIDTSSKKVKKHILLPNGSSSLRGIAISPDGKYAYVTHILSRFNMPTTQLERGWMNTNALSIIDITEAELVNTVLLDDLDLGSANPWAVICSPDGSAICVTSAGTHELSIIDRIKLHERLANAKNGSNHSGTAAEVSSDLTFLLRIRQRVKLNGNGPRAVAIIGSTAYIAEYFSDSIGVCSIKSNAANIPVSVALGPKKQLTASRRGEMLFNDANLCFQKWQSCISCHPDARADGLNWDLMNDGIGNPKNTRSMLLSHKTPPVMITGIRANAEAAVRSGIKFIQFAACPDEDASAIDEYLKNLDPIPSPYLVNGKLSEAAERGKKVFDKAECSSCHSGALFTDMKSYDVGTGTDMETGSKFDTPTLIECWRTGPYLYDGRALTIEEVLTKYNQRNRHGITSNLTRRELDDLIQYVLSL